MWLHLKKKRLNKLVWRSRFSIIHFSSRFPCLKTAVGILSAVCNNELYVPEFISLESLLQLSIMNATVLSPLCMYYLFLLKRKTNKQTKYRHRLHFNVQMQTRRTRHQLAMIAAASLSKSARNSILDSKP